MIPTSERTYIRELARRVADIAALPIQEKRRARWRRHNSLNSKEPMLLVFPEGSWRELIPEESLFSKSDAGRAIEGDLRRRIYYHANFCDDTVVQADVLVHKVVNSTGWGLEPRRIPSPDKTGAWHHDPVLKEFSDLKKLRTPELSYDHEQTLRNVADMQALLGDILPVRVSGVSHISYHLMQQYTNLRGYEPMLYDLYEEPKFVHEFLAFATTAHKSILEQYVKLNLLNANCDNTYHSTGGNGWTDETPEPGFDPNRVRPCDMWASSESQEFTSVSPAMHEEFALAYERELLAPFKRLGYGCCEDLTLKLNMVLDVPRIRRISVSPFTNVDRSAEILKDRCIYSWKPNPSMLVGEFNEEFIRAYIRHTLDVAKDCVLEIILKDTHTCENQPVRMHRWLQIAREEIDARTPAAG
jgi:hypothetical protein